MRKKIAVLGGDLRQVHLASMLCGPQSRVYGMFMREAPGVDPAIEKSDDVGRILPMCPLVVLPLPASTDGAHLNAPYAREKPELRRIFESIDPKATVFAGLLTEPLARMAGEKNIQVIDYFAREELAVLNAVPTAEGALEIVMRELPITVFGSRILITGFGRIAKVLIRLLLACGAHVWVAARKDADHAWIRVSGCTPIYIHELNQYAGCMDVVINTVPALLFDRALLSKLKKDCLVIDLASKPGGLDFEAAGELGLKTIWALSMPGKVAPYSAGEIIYTTLANCLRERGEAQFLDCEKS
jgi:dipicolinate synthase subunit A